MYKCQGKVWERWSYRPCHCKAVTAAGYCKAHDPQLKEARKKEQHTKWEAKWKVEQLISRRNLAAPLMQALLQRIRDQEPIGEVTRQDIEDILKSIKG